MIELKIVEVFNSSIFEVFGVAKNLVSKTELLPAALRTIKYQRRAVETREKWSSRGLHVPPLIIYSVTKRCNLKCVGCYHHAHHGVQQDLSTQRIRTLLDEAKELGVSIIILAGGEPLMRKDLIDIASDYPEILFPVFTNGLMIDEETVARFKVNRNIVPMISLEGPSEYTDNRRGYGVYEQVLQRFQQLNKSRIFFGTSITVTRNNLQAVTDDAFLKELCNRGVNAVVYVEYVPVEQGTENLVPTPSQRETLKHRLEELRRDYPALFISFPGDEEKLGGCLAAGRGFLHISQDGSIEPCPASPFSDTNIKDVTLKEALSSKFLEAIRSEPHSLEHSESGCALFDKENWVKSLLQTEKPLSSNSTLDEFDIVPPETCLENRGDPSQGLASR
jgi:MoaA/NifB/PqqE/SkfB family radical SAM enzyme